MKKKLETSTRLNLSFKPEVRNRMEGLVDETNVESITELIRRSIAVYDFLWEQKKSGAKLIVEDESGGQRELVIL